MSVLWESDDRTLIQILTEEPALLRRAYESGTPIRMPFEIREGVGEWRFTASLSEVVDV